MACRPILRDGRIEDESSLLHVQGHLVEKGLQGVENPLLPEMPGENHPSRQMVEIKALAVDAECLDPQVGAVKLGIRAHGDRGREPLPGGVEPSCVDAVGRHKHARCCLDISGRIPELPAAMVAMHDRVERANRDIYDVWFFLQNEPNEILGVSGWCFLFIII